MSRQLDKSCFITLYQSTVSRENFIKASIICSALKCACDMHSYDIHIITTNFSSYPAGYQLLKRPYLNL